MAREMWVEHTCCSPFPPRVLTRPHPVPAPRSGGEVGDRRPPGMSSKPISCTADDRRATHLRVTFRSPVVEDPVHFEMVWQRLYPGHLDRQTPCAPRAGYHTLGDTAG